jgi:transketolase
MTVSAPPPPTDAELAALARQVRWHILDTVAGAGAGHVGGPMSATDLLVTLYFSQLRIDPADPQAAERDRFILSKGHCAVALYATLALRGYFPVEELATFDHGDSRLQGHPDMRLTPGVDVSTGSLGMGLSVGAGISLAAKRAGTDQHTWVMVGDGELQEGMVWETVMSAPRFGLDNLTMVVDLNGLQQYGWRPQASDRFDRSEPQGHVDLPAVFRGFGWNVLEVDGHDLPQIREAYAAAAAGRGVAGRPTVILARTTKGAGVSFTSGSYRWHNAIATTDELAVAREELGIGPQSFREGILA